MLKGRLDYLLKEIEKDRVGIENEKIYQKLIVVGGLYDLNVREAERLLRDKF